MEYLNALNANSALYLLLAVVWAWCMVGFLVYLNLSLFCRHLRMVGEQIWPRYGFWRSCVMGGLVLSSKRTLFKTEGSSAAASAPTQSIANKGEVDS